MKKRISKKNNRSKLEMKLDEVNYIMELIRTVIPIIILLMCKYHINKITGIESHKYEN